ncbi:MAG: hypothetical protein Ct9H300mP11_05430 [Chloroflexota bacterium]|nr:MAG: hypothetical protein Ct9H300mP11_05430 [Chloroflexota bacterium]
MTVETLDDLSIAYTPGVASVCMEIHGNPSESYHLTNRANTVAVVTDGSAVLGLGNIGPEAAMPGMEGKSILFKGLADIDAFPICLATQDSDEIVQTVRYLAPSVGGIKPFKTSPPLVALISKTHCKTLGYPSSTMINMEQPSRSSLEL